MSRFQKQIPVYDGAMLKKIRAVCRLGREVLDAAHRAIKPGVTTDEIDRIVHEVTIQGGAYPSPLNYYHFPKSVCTSVNEVICHGIPDRRPLQEGDIVNVDVSLLLDGYHADLNETFAVGEISEDKAHLLHSAYKCLMNAIAKCQPGCRYRDLGAPITKTAQDAGLSVVTTYCGHGVGRHFHCAPNIPHYSPNKAPGRMQAGHVFTIEPMINQGSYKDTTWPDQWTAVTVDGKCSAQFEHTVLVTDDGVEILTARLEDSPPLYWEK